MSMNMKAAPRIRYIVTMSLDGYIAGPKGAVDWIVSNSEVDFVALGREFDILLVGRRTFEITAAATRTTIPGMQTVVCSRTLRKDAYPEVKITELAPGELESLRAGCTRDIWLFGGAELFRTLLVAGAVDTVEVNVIPVLLGAGVPLLPPPAKRVPLSLYEHRIYRNGSASLRYRIHKQASSVGAL